MATEDNTTDKLTLLPLDLTKQTERQKKLGETYSDLYSALAEAQANEDWSRVSAINQAIKAEDQGLGGSEAWNLAAADREFPAGTPGEGRSAGAVSAPCYRRRGTSAMAALQINIHRGGASKPRR